VDKERIFFVQAHKQYHMRLCTV